MPMPLRRYGILATVYTIGIVVGVREYRLARAMQPVAWPSEEWSRMAEVLSRIDPDEPETMWLQSQESLLQGDAEEFGARLEEAVASGIKDHSFLLHDYAQLMLDRRADYRIVNQAVNRWRSNHPSSPETLGLELGAGPRNPAEESVLEEALAQVPWIAGSWLESITDSDGNPQWVVQLAFRPATTIDMRDAIAAVTVLSLTEEQRAQFRLRCTTLEECNLVPRSR